MTKRSTAGAARAANRSSRASSDVGFSLDLIDRRILSLLQQDNRRSLEELADAVFSSRSAVQRRLGTMREAGVIRRDIAVVDPHIVDALETFVICLKVREERGRLLQEFCEMVQELPAVQQCYLTTGAANCVLILLLPNGEALRAFIDLHFTDRPFVEGVQTHLVTDEIKVGLTVPLE